MTCYFVVTNTRHFYLLSLSTLAVEPYYPTYHHVDRQGAVQARAALVGLQSVAGAVQPYEVARQEPGRVCNLGMSFLALVNSTDYPAS